MGNRNPYPTIKTAGLLLPVDLLTRIADGDPGLPGLSPKDYHLRSGERLSEATARAWNECQAAWKSFRRKLAEVPESDAATTVTRDEWLLPLFQELGYGRLQTKNAIVIDEKEYPVSHGWENHVPIHLLSARYPLDRPTVGVAGAATRSPYSMVQELLDGSLTRPSIPAQWDGSLIRPRIAATPSETESPAQLAAEAQPAYWTDAESRWHKIPRATRFARLAERAILDMKVCDSACGSGHFLIAAAERMARHLARQRTGDDEPTTLPGWSKTPPTRTHASWPMLGEVNLQPVRTCVSCSSPLVLPLVLPPMRRARKRTKNQNDFSLFAERIF